MLLNVTDVKADLSKIYLIIDGMHQGTNASITSIFTGNDDASGVKAWPFILLLVLMVAAGLGYVAYLRVKQTNTDTEVSKYSPAAHADEQM